MISFFLLLLLGAALVGVFRPYKGVKRRYFALIACGIFGVMVLIAPKPTPKELAKRQREYDQRLAETKAREDDSKKEAARRTAGRAAKMVIKEAARNPDSVSFIDVFTDDDATLVCVRYRAQNGFGGMNVETMAFKNGVARQSVKFWNKNCANVQLFDVS